MELSPADRIWNRACDIDETVPRRSGDRHLWALLRIDGAVQSGGVGFAADAMSSEQFGAAVEASHYFGLDELADLMRSIATSTPDDDGDLQARYDVIDNHHRIERAFRQRLADTPQDFEPPENLLEG